MQVDNEYRFAGVWTKDTASLFLPPEEFLNKTFREVLGDYADIFERAVDDTLKTGQSCIIEYRQPKTSRWYSAKFSPMTGGLGRNHNISVLIRDITATRHSAELIEQNAANLAALIDNTEDRIWSIDRNFRILSCNTSFLLHMKKKWNWDPKIGDQLPFDKFDRETSDFWLKSIASCFAGEAFVTERTRLSDSEIRNDEYSFNPIRDKNDAIVGAAIFGRNITARKEAEEELQEARRAAEESNKIRQQFIANMSHEIRTPINAIIGSTHLLLEEGLTEKQRYYVNTVTESSRFLLSMINDVLDLSKIDSGKLELDQSTFSLTGLIRSLELTTSGLAEQKGLKFDCVLEADPSDEYVVTDKARLLQVLVNLTGNAIKFTDSGSVSVNISVTRKSGSVRMLHIDVVDTGIGISAEQQQIIVKPFAQADKTISTKYGGTGLGLNISQKIVKALGGEIKVKSRPRFGSQFYFSIPVMVSARQKELHPDTSDSEKNFAGRVLIVEDHDFNRLFLKKLLTSYGFDVEESSNGEDAYRMVCSGEPYDLILLDLRMPRWDGYKTLEMIRSCSNGKTVPVWAHTADVMSDEQEKALRCGFSSFLPKPLDQEKLKIMISDLQSKRTVAPVAAPDINFELLRKTFQDPVVFNEIVDNLEASLKQNAAQLDEMLAAENYDQLRDLMHKMRPSASLVKMDSVLKLFARDLNESDNQLRRKETASALRKMIVANLSVMRERV
jgi:signal transduction histidine kinase/CheY-like chemotaxis protein